MVILENIDIGIDIDKAILQNIDIDKISNRFKFGISNRATCVCRPRVWKSVIWTQVKCLPCVDLSQRWQPFRKARLIPWHRALDWSPSFSSVFCPPRNPEHDRTTGLLVAVFDRFGLTRHSVDLPDKIGDDPNLDMRRFGKYSAGTRSQLSSSL